MYEEEDQSSLSDCEHAELQNQVQLNQRKNKLWNTISKSVLSRGIVDHMFEKHY